MESLSVLVTGGNGFLGRAVSAKLRQAAWVRDILAPTSSEVDLRNEFAVEALFAMHNIDVVIHLAATVGGIGANQKHPARFFRDNLLMGVNTIHASHNHGVQKLVCIGTICAYPKYAAIPFNEDELWNGYPEETNAPYGVAKRALLTMAQAYRQQYGFNAIYLLPVNLYGPQDNFDIHTSHVIPAMIRKFAEARDQGTNNVTLWGDGGSTREFLYVDDAADAIVRATELYDGAEPVNIGTGEEIRIRDLADLIASAVGYTGSIVWDARKPNGQPRRCLNVDRAKKSFGFTATTTLQQGIRKTVDWFESHRTELRELHFENL